MTKPTTRVWIAFGFAGVVATLPVGAQIQPRGWPGTGGDAATAAKPVTGVKVASVAVPAKVPAAPKPAAPRVSEKAAPKKAAVVAVAVARPAIPVVVAEASAPKAEPTVTPVPVASDATVSELVAALQQQADLLKRLATEIESQRAVMREQRDKVMALELRAAAPVPATAKAAPAVSTAVGTSGIEMKRSGLAPHWSSSANAGVFSPFRPRRTALNFGGEMTPAEKWTLIGDARVLSLSPTISSINSQNVMTGVRVSHRGRVPQDALVALTWKP